MSSYDRHGSINNPQQTGGKFSIEKEEGYVNDQDLRSSAQYEVLDYDSLNNSERDKDKNTYRWLDLKSGGRVPQEGAVKPRAGNGNTDNGDPSYKAREQRACIVVIVVLVVLLVATAVAFGVLYFKRTEDSPELPLTTSSAETTQGSTTPGDTTNTTTTSAPTTAFVPLTTSSAETTQGSTTSGATTNTTTTSAPTTAFVTVPDIITKTTQTFSTPDAATSTMPISLSPSTTGNSSAIQKTCWTYRIGLIPHPQECQAYYNCSYFGFQGDMIYDFEPFMMECPYPQLFNAETNACEHFEQVTCGDRKEAKQGCDYRAMRCPRALCPACDYRYPSCAGKEDGFNVHELRKWSPFYINCYKERFVIELICPTEPVFGTQLFSPEYKGCVGLDRIPKERGGRKPNCTGKEDGFYPNEYGRCTHYTECVFGQYKNTLVCPESQMFDEATKKCSESPTSLCICDKTKC